MMRERFSELIDKVQDQICEGIEKLDGSAKFHEDSWERPGGGGGRSRVIEYGKVFEKAGVNVSKVFGKLPESMMEKFGVKSPDFFACGVSLVIHPKNPFAPTCHANYRYFEIYDENGEIEKYWFGGGQDLTPHYYFEEDAIHFHKECKEVCDKYDGQFYPKFKKWCDEYFHNTHRNEARGIGGIFFDYLSEDENHSQEELFNFAHDMAFNFTNSYLPIVEKRMNTEYSEAQRDWQEVRRGRYVEFNLVHDRGTLFGLKTGGRIESILMSLPPKVQWKYDHHPAEGTPEYEMIEVLKAPKEYV